MPMTKKSSAGKTGRPPKVPGEKPTREKIFDAAVELFSEKGYDRTTVRDIARAAGITESAVYRHYPGKESILDAIFEYMEVRVYSPLPPLPDSGNQKENTIFRDLLEGLPRYMASEPVLARIIRILFMEMHHNEKIRDYIKREYVERAEDYTEALFQKQIDDNKIRSCDPRVLAEVFNAFRSTWLFRNFIIDYGKTPDVQAMEEELRPHIEFFEHFFVP